METKREFSGGQHGSGRTETGVQAVTMRVGLSLFLKFIYVLGDEELQSILFYTDFHEDSQLCHFDQGIRACTCFSELFSPLLDFFY